MLSSLRFHFVMAFAINLTVYWLDKGTGRTFQFRCLVIQGYFGTLWIFNEKCTSKINWYCWKCNLIYNSMTGNWYFFKFELQLSYSWVLMMKKPHFLQFLSSFFYELIAVDPFLNIPISTTNSYLFRSTCYYRGILSSCTLGVARIPESEQSKSKPTYDKPTKPLSLYKFIGKTVFSRGDF